jgi:hypothetical protein
MRIEYFHHSVYGNGAAVAAEFRRLMATRGVTVNVHHLRDVKPDEVPPADLYLFSSPGRLGKPIKDVRRFLKRLELAPGAKYALLTTEMAPQPDRKTGRVPSEEEFSRYQRVRPILNELLEGKGLVKVAEGKVQVLDVKGPLEDGWQAKVEAFASRIPL